MCMFFQELFSPSTALAARGDQSTQLPRFSLRQEVFPQILPINEIISLSLIIFILHSLKSKVLLVQCILLTNTNFSFRKISQNILLKNLDNEDCQTGSKQVSFLMEVQWPNSSSRGRSTKETLKGSDGHLQTLQYSWRQHLFGL